MNPEYLDIGPSETHHDHEYILTNKVFYQMLGKTMDTVQKHARNSRCSEYGSDMYRVYKGNTHKDTQSYKAFGGQNSSHPTVLNFYNRHSTDASVISSKQTVFTIAKIAVCSWEPLS